MKKRITGIILASLMSLTFLAGAGSVRTTANAESKEIAIHERLKIREERNCVISTLAEEIISGKTYTFKLGGEEVGRFKVTKYRRGWAISKGSMFVGVRNNRIVYKLSPTQWTYEDGAFAVPVKKVHFGLIHIDTSEKPTQYIGSFKVGAKLTTEKTVFDLYDVIHTTHVMSEWTDCEDGVHHKRICINGCGYEEVGEHNFGEFNSSLTCLECGAENHGTPEVSISATFFEQENVKLVNVFFGKPVKTITYFADVEVGYYNVGVSKVELRLNKEGDFFEGRHCSLDSRIKILEVRVTDTRGNVHTKEFYNFVASFDLQGRGSSIKSIDHLKLGDKIAAPEKPSPTKDEIFAGWYKEAECINPWNFDVDTIQDDTVLFAKWIKGNTLSSVLSLSYDVFPYATNLTPIPTKAWVNEKGIRAFISGNYLVIMNGSSRLTLSLKSEFALNEKKEYVFEQGSVTWRFNLVKYFGFDYLGYFEIDGSDGFDGAYGKSYSKINDVITNAEGFNGFPVGETRPANAWVNEAGSRLFYDSLAKAVTIETSDKGTIVLENSSPVSVFDNYVIRDTKNNIKLNLNFVNGKLSSINATGIGSFVGETSEYGTFNPACDLGTLLATTSFPKTDVNKAPLDAWLNGTGGKAYIDFNGNFAIEGSDGIIYSDSLDKPYVYKGGYYVNFDNSLSKNIKVGLVDGVVKTIDVDGQFGSAVGSYSAYGIIVSSILDTLKVVFPYFNGNGEVWRNLSGASVSYDEETKSIVFNTFSILDTAACFREGDNYVCTYKKGFDTAKVTFVMNNGSLSAIVVSDTSLMLARAVGKYIPTSLINTVEDVLNCSKKSFPVRNSMNNNNSNAIPEEAWVNENDIKCFVQETYNGEELVRSLVFCEVLDIQGYKIEKKITIDNTLDNIDAIEGNYVYQYFTFKMTKGVLSSIEVNYPEGSLYVSFNGSYKPVI